MNHASPCNRRTFIATSAAAMGAAAMGSAVATEPPMKAQIAVTLDLEMSRNFPTWESTHWDFEKGNLNDETKRYAVEAARRVKEAGGVVHFFLVGRTLEQDDVAWLKELLDQGHSLGNHTYDHVNVTAQRAADLQFRFQRSPWLLRGQAVDEAIRENISLTNHAMKERLGIEPAGFRTPGGFTDGLREHASVRGMLKDLGFSWVSSLYPPQPPLAAMQEPSEELLEEIVATLPKAQPFLYDDGLLEIPMSPVSDIGAFRTGRWRLDWFLASLRRCLQWTIKNARVYDFLAHPSCLYVVDPNFEAIDLICEMVRDAGDQAELASLDAIAQSRR
jgi:hypothetical protein